MSAFADDFSGDFDIGGSPTPQLVYRSPISAHARRYVRSRATGVMECVCQITRNGRPEGYDETTLVFTAGGPKELVYEGRCRIWELSGAAAVVVGDTDVYQQTTQLSIPWDTSAIIMRYDEVEILSAPQDSQVTGKRYEIQTVAKAGELRATRRFEVTGVM
jgi:Family of unknown function (DUF6093)